MTNYVRRVAGTPLTDKELQELKALAAMPDSEIDFSDIPESTEEQLRNFKRRPRSGDRPSPELNKAS